MISKTAEYALRAVVYLAAETNGKPDGDLQTLGQIASGTQSPVGYLSKVLQQLAHAGIVTSQRGLGGGFRLARSPQTITVYDVVQPVDPIGRITVCPLGLEAHSQALCPLHAHLDAAAEKVEAAFRAAVIADLIEIPVPLCQVFKGEEAQ